MPVLRYRCAEFIDSTFLYAVRNHPDIRKASVHTGEITLSQHDQWVSQTLTNGAIFVFIVTECGLVAKQDIGVLRIESRGAYDHIGTLSFAFLPEARGQGYGQYAFHFLNGYAMSIGMECLQVKVRATNDTALKFFQTLGFYKPLHDLSPGQEFIRLVRSI